jgi:hypothetical protein
MEEYNDITRVKHSVVQVITDSEVADATTYLN